LILFQGMSTRKYGMRGPLRGPTPQNQTAPRVIRVSNPNYGSSTSTQPQYMEFIPTPGFPKQGCLFKLCFWTSFINTF